MQILGGGNVKKNKIRKIGRDGEGGRDNIGRNKQE